MLEMRKEKQKQLKRIGIDIPERFISVDDYFKKLQELVDAETKLEELDKQQQFTAKDIKFKFIFMKAVTCKMELYVPKIYGDFMKENLVLQVFVPFKQEEAKNGL